jgi:hypothetical protein
MPVPGTFIRLSAEIATELQFTPGSIIKISEVYAVAQAPGTVNSGSYHNLSIGSSGAEDTFANVIYTPYSANADLKLVNWAGYDHQANNIFSFDITNNSANDYEVSFYLSDFAGALLLSIGVWVVNNGTNLTQNNYNTGINAYNFTGNPADPYFIDCEIKLVTGSSPNTIMTVQTSFDTDGVGPVSGTARIDYTTANGAYDLAPTTGVDFKDCLISGSGAFTINGIPWNRRTSVVIMIQ